MLAKKDLILSTYKCYLNSLKINELTNIILDKLIEIQNGIHLIIVFFLLTICLLIKWLF